MSDIFEKKYKKPYDAAYRRARYEKDREKILAWQREYDAAHTRSTGRRLPGRDT